MLFRSVIGSARQGGGKRRDASAIVALYGLKSLIEAFIGAVSKARSTTRLSQEYATEEDRLAELWRLAKRVALRLALRSTDAG